LPKLSAALPFIPFGVARVDLPLLALELLGVGAAVGIVAAWASVGRHLRT
jgi:hypothetical protein